MPPAAARNEYRLGTFLPYQLYAPFVTLFLATNQLTGTTMFIFQRPLAAPLLALATSAVLVVLDTLADLTGLF
jgi:hypothetical protein